MKSDYRMFVSIGFGYCLIFNMVGTNRYNMYPAWMLVMVCFSIGILMVVGSMWIFTKGIEEKKIVEVYSIPRGSPYLKPRPRISMA